MARKTLSDFGGDHKKYADYLESPQCTNDDGYDVIADQYGNVYTPTNGDWEQGHGHKNPNTNYDRKPDAPASKGRPWKNPWLKYVEELILTENDIEFLKTLYPNGMEQECEIQEEKTLKKTR